MKRRPSYYWCYASGGTLLLISCIADIEFNKWGPFFPCAAAFGIAAWRIIAWEIKNKKSEL